MKFSSPRDLGAAGEGVGHWWLQRTTSAALAPLSLWVCFSLALLPDLSHAQFTAWLSSPFNAVAALLLALIVCLHAALGLRVVIEDYVGSVALRIAAAALVDFVMLALALLAVVSAVKVVL